jgi:hypothetical protein
MHAKRQSSSETTHVVQATIGHLNSNGSYAAIIEDIVSFGSRLQLSVRLGHTPLLVLTNPRVNQINDLCRLDIDPRSQIWKAS